MRALTTAQDTILSGRFAAEHVRVWVKDSSGVFRDLTTYAQINLLDSVEWGEDIDNVTADAVVTLRREIDYLSLAPLMQNSALNRQFNPTGAYAPLIDANREFKIEVAIVPAGTPLANVQAGDWVQFFYGRIDGWDEASGSNLTFKARDLGKKLTKAYIERERVYSLASVAGAAVGCHIWETNAPFVLNEYVIPTKANMNGHFYKVTTAGTSDATNEPVWPTGTGSTIANGSVVFTEAGLTSNAGNPVEQVIQSILNDWAPGVTLFTPSSPGLNLKQFIQQREPVMDAIRRLAMTNGWDVRYKWRAATAQYELTLYGPNRSNTTPDRTFGPSDYDDVTRLEVNEDNVRNKIQLVISDSADLDRTNVPRRKFITVSDATSISKFDTAFMEVSEDSSSPIDTVAEGTTMVNAMLSDLKDPKADQSVVLTRGFPFAELCDLYQFNANGRHYDVAQKLAVVKVRHRAQGGKIKSTIDTRGTPAGAYTKWIAMGSKPAANEPALSHLKQGLDASGGITLTTSKTVGGVRIGISETSERVSISDGYEVHLSKTSGFTPSSSTIADVARSKYFSPQNLYPGDNYYGRVVPRGNNLSRPVDGMPGPEFAFTPGYVEPAHLNPATVPQVLPPNGSFEGWTRTGDGGAVPDQWSMTTGTWLTDAQQIRTDRYDGIACVQLMATAVAAKMQSANFPVIAGVQYNLEGWVKKVATPTNSVKIAVDWLDSTQALISSSTITQALSGLGTGWSLLSTRATSPANAVYARCTIAKNDTGTFACNFDAIRLAQIPSDSLLVSTFGPAIFTTSSTFATVASGTFTQDKASQLIRVVGGATAFATTAGTIMKFRCLYNSVAQGTDHIMYYNTAAQHQGWPLCWQFTGAALPGSYTLAIQWMSNNNVNRFDMDVNDYLSVVAS